jgi:prophage antirepressor-like protein
LKHHCLTDSGFQELKIISEGDIYRLIIKSKLPLAEKFESWIFDDVLPTCR